MLPVALAASSVFIAYAAAADYGSGSSSGECAATLGATCGHAFGLRSACGICASAHQHDLRSAGCTNEDVTTVCGASASDVVVTVDPSVRLSIGGSSALDRLKWFGGHWSPGGGEDWRPEDYAEFGPTGFRAHPGRSFVVSGAMSMTKEDPERPGFVDRQSLLSHCAKPTVADLGFWPVADVDMVHSSKTGQLYPNSCKGEGGQSPKGFQPGSHAATAEFFALYYEHCMYPTIQKRYLMEVANECNVKTRSTACNTSWLEMVQLHVAVADAVHSAHAQEPTRPVPLVCGPTAAFPQYEAQNFTDWRDSGKFGQFVNVTAGHIDCLSIHLYDTFEPEPDTEETNPFSSNFSSHSGSNLVAELDLQESATAKISNDGTPLPLLVSEYGSGFGGQPRYTPGHDWWVLRGVTAKLMEFLRRPDRILKALPFISGKATWNAASRANNASHSYPFLLWRTLTPPGGDPNNSSQWLFVQTYLHLWFAMMQELDGDRVKIASDNAGVQAHAFHNGSRLQVVLNHLAFAEGANRKIQLKWPARLQEASRTAEMKRMFWSVDDGTPAMTTQALSQLPTELQLGPSDLVLLTIPLTSVPTNQIDERTYYSGTIIEPMAVVKAQARPYSFSTVGAPGSDAASAGGSPRVVSMRVRVGFGGSGSSIEDATAAFYRASAALHIEVDGVPCVVDYMRQTAGRLHIDSKEFTYFTSIEVAVPIDQLDDDSTERNVVVWSEAARYATVATVVLVVESDVTGFDVLAATTV
eukprot:COSAG02_NODE_608_length_19607_cov_201.543059_1_plen_753_part_00